MIKQYRKKPITIEAIQFTGINTSEMEAFCGDNVELFYKKDEPNCSEAKIMTLEGVMTASVGDYIIKGVNGEFYPCKEDIFHKTYEEIV